MGKIQVYVEKIKAQYPKLEIVTAEINQDGQYNDVLVVNNGLIFRFAKVKDAVETLSREVSVLRYLQNHISLPIPNPQFENFDREVVGGVFMGYRMIPGIPLWRKNFQKITDFDVKKRMAVQLAIFLKELHQVSVNDLPLAFQNADTRAYWAEMYQSIQEKLYPQMRSDARKQISNHFETFLTNSEKYHFEPKLRHGDFGAGNILFDPESQSIAGVIDFGGIGVGDPAGDYAGLYTSFGEEFYRNCYGEYPEMAYALDRVKIYIGTFALQEALFGYENDDPNAYKSGMAEYV